MSADERHTADYDAPCCVPDDGEEHCNHHDEWHDERGCNHPACRVNPRRVATLVQTALDAHATYVIPPGKGD